VTFHVTHKTLKNLHWKSLEVHVSPFSMQRWGKCWPDDICMGHSMSLSEFYLMNTRFIDSAIVIVFWEIRLSWSRRSLLRIDKVSYHWKCKILRKIKVPCFNTFSSAYAGDHGLGRGGMR
jgi:hypothetical protein